MRKEKRPGPFPDGPCLLRGMFGKARSLQATTTCLLGTFIRGMRQFAMMTPCPSITAFFEIRTVIFHEGDNT